MNESLLDLDTLIPETKKIKLNGEMYDVLPVKLEDFIVIQKMFLKMKDAKPEEQIDAISEINTALKPVVPDIEKMSLTIEQLFALLNFVYSISSLSDKQTMATTEKKTDSPEPSPTS